MSESADPSNMCFRRTSQLVVYGLLCMQISCDGESFTSHIASHDHYDVSDSWLWDKPSASKSEENNHGAISTFRSGIGREVVDFISIHATKGFDHFFVLSRRRRESSFIKSSTFITDCAHFAMSFSFTSFFKLSLCSATSLSVIPPQLYLWNGQSALWH